MKRGDKIEDIAKDEFQRLKLQNIGIYPTRRNY